MRRTLRVASKHNDDAAATAANVERGAARQVSDLPLSCARSHRARRCGSAGGPCEHASWGNAARRRRTAKAHIQPRQTARHALLALSRARACIRSQRTRVESVMPVPTRFRSSTLSYAVSSPILTPLSFRPFFAKAVETSPAWLHHPSLTLTWNAVADAGAAAGLSAHFVSFAITFPHTLNAYAYLPPDEDCITESLIS